MHKRRCNCWINRDYNHLAAASSSFLLTRLETDMKASLKVTPTHLFGENLKSHMFSPVIRDVNATNSLKISVCRLERSESRRSLCGKMSAQMFLTLSQPLHRQADTEGEKAVRRGRSQLFKKSSSKTEFQPYLQFGWVVWDSSDDTECLHSWAVPQVCWDAGETRKFRINGTAEACPSLGGSCLLCP